MAPSLSFSLKPAGNFTFTQNVLPGRKIAPPAFSRSFNINAGGGEGDDDFSARYPWAPGGKKPDYLCTIRLNTSIDHDEYAMTFRFEVPGYGKEDIKVAVENYKLTVVNLKQKKSGNDEAGLLMMLHVWPCWFKPSLITADVKHGLLTVVVPKADKVN